MGNPIRRFEHNKPYFITNRVARGLPFVPNEVFNRILKGAAARALAMNPGIKLTALEFLQNHYHVILVPMADPKGISSLLHDLDDEIAKDVNRLLGRRNENVWDGRAHVALLGNVDAVEKQLVYSYLNPVAANFVDKASQWFGVGSYRFLFDQTPERHKWIPSSKLSKLPNAGFTRKGIKRLCRYLDSIESEEYLLEIDPYIWKQCFNETKNLSNEVIRERILKRITEEEDYYRRQRKEQRQCLVDVEQLILQNPHKPYKPEKFGRRVYCICTDPELRRMLIQAYQTFCKECRTAWQSWKAGDFSAKYPPGAFLPPRPPLANIMPGYT